MWQDIKNRRQSLSLVKYKNKDMGIKGRTVYSKSKMSFTGFGSLSKY